MVGLVVIGTAEAFLGFGGAIDFTNPEWRHPL
jgi:hypothetical protein